VDNHRNPIEILSATGLIRAALVRGHHSKTTSRLFPFWMALRLTLAARSWTASGSQRPGCSELASPSGPGRAASSRTRPGFHWDKQANPSESHLAFIHGKPTVYQIFPPFFCWFSSPFINKFLTSYLGSDYRKLFFIHDRNPARFSQTHLTFKKFSVHITSKRYTVKLW